MLLCDLLMVLSDCGIEILDKNGKHITYGTVFRNVFPISSQKVLNVTTGRGGEVVVTINYEVKENENN